MKSQIKKTLRPDHFLLLKNNPKTPINKLKIRAEEEEEGTEEGNVEEGKRLAGGKKDK
jgi:hypothetical protein